MRGLNPVTYRRYYYYDNLGSVRAVPAEYGDLFYNFEYWLFREEYTSSEFNEDSYGIQSMKGIMICNWII